MSARSLKAAAAHFPYDHTDDGFENEVNAYDDDFGEFYSGEPVCPSSLPRQRKPLRRIYTALFFVLAAGWIYAHGQSDWIRFAVASLLRLTEETAPAPPNATDTQTADGTGSKTTPSTGADLPTQSEPKDVAAAPVPETALALPPVTATTGPETDSKAIATPNANAEPLSTPVVDPSDPYQKRASASGLHPGLSRVLLAKLTPADYRNAKIAIDSAIAKTPENGTFVWPQQPKPKLALFEVHFVAGAAPDCRRYVVKIAKDGWETTARPMEKCGTTVQTP